MNCNLCGDLGYITEPGEEFAFARVCSCQSPCPVCNDSGLIVDRSKFPAVAGPCNCSHLKKRVARFNAAGLPAIMHNKDVDRLENPTESQWRTVCYVKNFMQDYQPGQRGFLLWGRPGTAKWAS